METVNNKQAAYELLLKQCKSLTEGESDPLANLCNILALVHGTMGFLWTGIYRVCGQPEGEPLLILGPFQGPAACTRIKYGKGVCGTCWQKNEGLLVPDVEEFPGHIRCSSAARSEVVVPIRKDGEVCAVLDIDSSVLNGLDADDLYGLQAVADLIGTLNPA